ncbi:MAG: hypothetical protein KKA05_07980 [Alphaproteobacteria bacterium]|nr:hypothetical protein [Alphaproteobacteria bacterium]MBU0858520.1 hypothetical protein [Alphaproteobacteria bacterium]
MKQHSAMRSAYLAADEFAYNLPRHISALSGVFVDATLNDDNEPQLIVHVDEDVIDMVAASMGNAVTVTRAVGQKLSIEGVVVEYRPVQPVMEIG